MISAVLLTQGSSKNRFTFY